MHNAFHCAKCTETCHRSLCNYFLQTLKDKRRRQNKFGVAALFPRFTTKRIRLHEVPVCTKLRANGILFVVNRENNAATPNLFSGLLLFLESAKNSCKAICDMFRCIWHSKRHYANGDLRKERGRTTARVSVETSHCYR